MANLMLVLLVLSSSVLTMGMEPMVGPLATQTTIQAGGKYTVSGSCPVYWM